MTETKTTEEIRLRVNRMVRHIEQPDKRNRIAKNLRKFFTELQSIPAEQEK